MKTFTQWQLRAIDLLCWVLFLCELGSVRHHKDVSDEDHGQNKRSLLITDVEVATQVWSNRSDHILASKKLFDS